MKIPKGLKISQIRTGFGKVAEPGTFAVIQYDCYLPRGEKCDSSRNRGYPVQLKVGERSTYPAIAYALPGMTVGEIRNVKVSPNLTYYERNQNPNLPPGVALRYEIELISVSDHFDISVYRMGDETCVYRPLTGLEIRCSNQNHIEISGSASLLNEIAQRLYNFLKSNSATIVFEADPSCDPSPYDSVLMRLRLMKGTEPATASIIENEEVVVEGSEESLLAFASLFEFEFGAAKNDHSHFEYEDYEGNRFVSRGSIPIVISVR